MNLYQRHENMFINALFEAAVIQTRHLVFSNKKVQKKSNGICQKSDNDRKTELQDTNV